MAIISGEQRLRNLKSRARIEGEREMREFLAGKRDFLECSMDRLDALICKEFDRLANPPQEPR